MGERPADRGAGTVTLSSDFDGPSLWLMRRMATPTPISRGEFGAVAVPRILRLLGRRGIPATFFIPATPSRPTRTCAGWWSNRYPHDGPVEWGCETPLVELPWSWSQDDYPYLEFVAFPKMVMPGLHRPEDLFANLAGDVAWMVEHVTNGVYVAVFHPQVIGRDHRLLALERWLDGLTDLGITFSTMAEVAAAVDDGEAFGIEER